MQAGRLILSAPLKDMGVHGGTALKGLVFMRFQINNLLIFDDETMTVTPLGSRGVPHVKLGSIHSRCFACLCKRHLEKQNIVSKKELFFAGWEKHGLVSSNNSLAQTIFQLRKSLKVFNLEGMIVTVPRVGFKLQQTELKPLPCASNQSILEVKSPLQEAGFLKGHPISAQKTRQFASPWLTLGLMVLLPACLYTTFVPGNG